ncbi:MAG: DUF4389 domain-containing protein [Oligoflexales bacterium]
MDQNLKENLKHEDTWKRGFIMLLFIICYAVAEGVASVVMIIQFLWVLITRQPNPKLTMLGCDLASYFQQLVLYLTWNHDQKPWPIGDWPSTKKK